VLSRRPGQAGQTGEENPLARSLEQMPPRDGRNVHNIPLSKRRPGRLLKVSARLPRWDVPGKNRTKPGKRPAGIEKSLDEQAGNLSVVGGTMRRTTRPLLAGLALLAVLAASPGRAAVTVFLDYTNFPTRLNELAGDAGVALFNAGEQAQIRANILSHLQTMYSSYDMTFTETAPVAGNFERLLFGATTANVNLLGLAQQIDLRNANKNNSADVYTRNFAFHINEPLARADQITQLSRGLSYVAGHELGHNHGLEHADAYARPGITPSTYANTGGIQNEHVMATGPTGINEAQREQPKTFSTLSHVKLEYADGMRPTTPGVIAEQGAAHGTIATAQALTLTPLPISGVDAFFVTGNIGASGEFDFYSFTALAGSSFTAHAISESIFSAAQNVDTVLTLFDPGGNMLFEVDDIRFGSSTYNSGALYDGDSLLINIPLLTTGTYTVRVRGFNTDTGQYNLVGYVAAAPEPAALTLLVCGLLLTTRRRKRAA
jgi:hypothetical protein